MPFVLGQLGLPDRLDDHSAPLPEDGIWRGISARLDAVVPGYADWVRTLEWHRDGIHHHVFLIIINDRWEILDAVAWADGVDFR